MGGYDIPPHAFEAAVDLLKSHGDEYGDDLKGMAFVGPILSDPFTKELELVEVFENWPETQTIRFAPSASLRWSGTVTLHLIPQHSSGDLNKAGRSRVLESLRQGYRIVDARPYALFDAILFEGLEQPTSADPRDLRALGFGGK